MVDTLFRNWKSAALLVVGVSTLAAAFFAEGGGHESLDQSAEQIRDSRGAAPDQAAGAVQPAAATTPVPVGPVAAASEEAEPEFGAPMDLEETPAPAKRAPPKPQDGESDEGQDQQDQNEQQF